MNRGDVLALIQEWRAVVRSKSKGVTPGRTLDDIVKLGSKMASALEEIARR